MSQAPRMNETPAVKYLEKVTARALELASGLRADVEHPWHRHMACLYGTVLEYGHAIAVCVRFDAAIGASPLLRSLLEAMVDLKNLAADRQYGYVLSANTLKERLSFLRYISSSEIPSIARLRSDPRLSVRITELNALVPEQIARAGGRERLKLKHRFEAAGLAQEYGTTYSRLCGMAHNDGDALERRHLAKDPDGKVTINYHRAGFALDLEDELMMAASLVAGCNKIIHEALPSTCQEGSDALMREIELVAAAGGHPPA